MQSLIGTDILSLTLRNTKHKIDLPVWGFPFQCFSAQGGEFWMSGRTPFGFSFAYTISSSGLRQYRQQVESCMGLMLPSGQKSVSTKMFRLFTSVRRYSVAWIMTINPSFGKFNNLGKDIGTGTWDNLSAKDTVTGIPILDNAPLHGALLRPVSRFPI